MSLPLLYHLISSKLLTGLLISKPGQCIQVDGLIVIILNLSRTPAVLPDCKAMAATRSKHPTTTTTCCCCYIGARQPLGCCPASERGGCACD